MEVNMDASRVWVSIWKYLHSQNQQNSAQLMTEMIRYCHTGTELCLLSHSCDVQVGWNAAWPFRLRSLWDFVSDLGLFMKVGWKHVCAVQIVNKTIWFESHMGTEPQLTQPVQVLQGISKYLAVTTMIMQTYADESSKHNYSIYESKSQNF